MPEHDLPTQIAYARRVLDRTGARDMVSIINTLEWLYANQDKIKAKIEAVEFHGIVRPMPEPPAPSGRIYRQRCKMFLDYNKGGWSQHYEVFDDADRIIGSKNVGCATRHHPLETHYVLLDGREFTSLDAFIGAYEAQAKPAAASEAA